MDHNQETVTDIEARLAEVATAYLRAAEAGPTPDPQEWLARYPDLAGELITAFLAAEFDGAERYRRRLEKIEAMEREGLNV